MKARIRRYTIYVLIGAVLAIGAVYGAGKAFACDPGQYYDPSHQICQGSAPAYPRPGYGPWQNNYPGIPRDYPGGGWGSR
jgi:hypothetical protein